MPGVGGCLEPVCALHRLETLEATAMSAFLFWNLDGKNIADDVAELALERLADFVIVAECESPASLLEALNEKFEKQQGAFTYLPTKSRVHVFVRFDDRYATLLYETPHFTIRHVQLPMCVPLLVAAVHLIGKRDFKDSSQDTQCGFFVNDLISLENDRVHHTNTVVVGDINMNPYQDGVVSVAGLHGVPTKALARKKERIVQGRTHKMFYNPMWRFFGERAPDGPAGTCYYWKAENVWTFWNIYDQVLIRPSLIDRFPDDAMEVVSEIGGVSLLREGVPHRERFSDHLPIVFEIDLRQGNVQNGN
jgi:endonuclease/exonuclease/phosphatase family metal-dependent hydrolase